MTEDVRATLWQAMQAQGITGPEMFALRYGRRLQDLTPAKALEIITTLAVWRVPPIPPSSSDSAPVRTERKER